MCYIIDVPKALHRLRNETAPPVLILAGLFFVLNRCEQSCKPGSVFDNHLSGTHVATRLKPSVGTDGPPIAPVDVAADRVYRPPMLPWGVVSSYLAFPPLPQIWNPRRYFSVALFLGSPPADVICYPCPVQPGLSSYWSSQYATVWITHVCYYINFYGIRQTVFTKRTWESSEKLMIHGEIVIKQAESSRFTLKLSGKTCKIN